jgi:phage repressor protein C with HTH and peptisase S24 domain
MNKFEINSRILELIEYLKIGQNKFAKEIGISSSRMSNIATLRNKPDSEMLQAIVKRFTYVSAEWLLTGNGLMISKTGNGIEDEIRIPEKRQIDYELKNNFHLKSDSRKEIQSIPLYNLEAAAGLVPLFNEASKPIPLDYISIPNLPKCDGAIYVVGDSMYPLLKSGDIVLYKQVYDIQNGIFYGEMYLLSLDMSGEEYIVVKYIQKSDLPDHVKLVSYNIHHSEKDVLISSIRALAYVKASIRINSMI